MRSLRRQISFPIMGSVGLLTAILILIFHFQVNSVVLKAQEIKAKTDLAVTEAMIDYKYPGHWNVQDEQLYKGQTHINNNFSLVDDIKSLTGNTCVVFLKNICVSTTVPEGDCNRAIGLYAPYEVTSKVLEAGQCYTGHVELAGEKHYIAYKPIKSQYGEIIGVLYVGVPTATYDAARYDSIKIVMFAGLVLVLLIGLITRFVIARSLVEPVQEVIDGTQEAAINSLDKTQTSKNERGELAQAIEPMLGADEQMASGLEVLKEEQQIERKIECPSKQEQLASGNEEESECFDPLLDSQQELPKGLNSITLKQIVLFLKQQEGNEVTIQDVSEAVSLSKVTVRHYFDYLDEIGLVVVEQKYGAVGRPQRIYKLKV